MKWASALHKQSLIIHSFIQSAGSLTSLKVLTYIRTLWILKGVLWCNCHCGHGHVRNEMAAATTVPLPKPAVVEGALSSAWESIQDEAVKILQTLIRIDTQNYGEDGGNETEAALYLKGLFDAEGIECTQVSAPCWLTMNR